MASSACEETIAVCLGGNSLLPRFRCFRRSSRNFSASSILLWSRRVVSNHWRPVLGSSWTGKRIIGRDGHGLYGHVGRRDVRPFDPEPVAGVCGARRGAIFTAHSLRADRLPSVSTTASLWIYVTASLDPKRSDYTLISDQESQRTRQVGADSVVSEFGRRGLFNRLRCGHLRAARPDLKASRNLLWHPAARHRN